MQRRYQCRKLESSVLATARSMSREASGPSAGGTGRTRSYCMAWTRDNKYERSCASLARSRRAMTANSRTQAAASVEEG